MTEIEAHRHTPARPVHQHAGTTGTPSATARQVLNACTEDCQAARRAKAEAARLLESTDPDTAWEIQAWALPSPPGEIRLTLAGYPMGRVPRDFTRTWLLALADAALDEVRLLNEQDRL